MLVELLLGVVSTLRLLSTSYRFFAGLRLSCVSGAQHETSNGSTRVHGGSVSGLAVEYTSAVHASAPIENLRVMHSAKTRVVLPAGPRGCLVRLPKLISAVHSTIIENLLIAYKRCAARKNFSGPTYWTCRRTTPG